MLKKFLKATLRISLATLLVLIVVAAAIAADYYLYPLLIHPSSTDKFQKQRNGLWLGSKWYMGKVTDAEIKAIAEVLNKEQIKYAYFHCRDINASGNLRIPSEKSAKHFVSMLHEQCPDTKIMIWEGAVSTITGGEVDLSKKAVRENMANAVANLADSANFDGVQWDVEAVPNESHDFVDLLDRTRAKLPEGKMLSICAPSGSFNLEWSPQYISETSKHCDQISLMAYDTAMWLPRMYVSTMEKLVKKFANAMSDSGTHCKLLVGVPTYEDATLAHHKQAESLEMGILGVKNALKDPSVKSEIVEGIAPYAEYTTDKAEWSTYEKFWLIPISDECDRRK
jgi:hypothetical protein